MQEDPYKREGVKVRLIQCAVVRGYEKAERLVKENKMCGETTDLCVLHGTHALLVAAVLEACGPKGSRVEGEHEFPTLGLYTCPDGELTPFSYATRARIVMDQSERNSTNSDVGWMPFTQFIFRGDETVEGAATKNIKTCGGDHQHI